MSDILKVAARKKPGKIIYPAAYKKKYFLSLKEDLGELYGEIQTLNLNHLSEQSNASFLTDSKSVIDLILDFFLGLDKTAGSTSYLKKTLDYVAEKTDAFNRRNVQNSLFDPESVSGIPAKKKLDRVFNPLPNSVRDTVMQGFISENLDLIVTVKRDLVERSKRLVISEIQAGNSPAMISEKLEHRYNASVHRAQFIAEDQVNKYVADLTRVRHEALGLRRYRWRTMEDSVVRKRCRSLQGKIFLYSDPPAGGHPGKLPNCRCWQEAIIEDLFIEEDLRKEPA